VGGQATQADGARLRLEMIQTERTGPTGRLQLATERTVALGNTSTLYGVAGRGANANLCDAAFVRDPAARESVYTWQVDATVMAVSATSTTVNLRWSRSRRDQDGLHQELAESTPLTLAVGDYRLLDYVRSAEDSPSACSSLALRIQVEPLLQAPPGSQDLTFDLWLAYDGKTGPRSIHRHARASSSQAVPLTFDVLKWAAGGEPVSTTYDALALGVDVGGTLRATLRPDGLVDVSMEVTRGFQWGHWKSRGDGRQAFRCEVDEPVEIILPNLPSGEAATPTPSGWKGPTAEGIRVAGDKVFIAPARFLAGGRLSVFIVVHRDGQTPRERG
jgi:hypothetical protein